MGISSTDINLREKLFITSWEDEPAAWETIANFFQTYLHLEKEELLALVQKKRKAFLQQITQALKPLGFRKQGNLWVADLTPEYNLQWHAQKSDFSDQYYFNLRIRKKGTPATSQLLLYQTVPWRPLPFGLASHAPRGVPALFRRRGAARLGSASPYPSPGAGKTARPVGGMPLPARRLPLLLGGKKLLAGTRKKSKHEKRRFPL